MPFYVAPLPTNYSAHGTALAVCVVCLCFNMIMVKYTTNSINSNCVGVYYYKLHPPKTFPNDNFYSYKSNS